MGRLPDINDNLVSKLSDTKDNFIKWGIHLTPETPYMWKSLMLCNARSRRRLPWDMESVYGLVLNGS